VIKVPKKEFKNVDWKKFVNEVSKLANYFNDNFGDVAFLYEVETDDKRGLYLHVRGRAYRLGYAFLYGFPDKILADITLYALGKIRPSIYSTQQGYIVRFFRDKLVELLEVM